MNEGLFESFKRYKMRREDEIRFHKGLQLEICPIRSKLSIVISVGKSLLLLVCVGMMRLTTLGRFFPVKKRDQPIIPASIELLQL